jgi:cytochrome b6-f complex iron-sulfur subunit
MSKLKNTNEFELSVSRKQFLRTAGSAALFAALGISISSCNVNDATSDSGGSSTPPPSLPPNSPAINIQGNTITIDLSQSTTSNLKTQGQWLLISQATTIVVNVDGTTIRAFTSVCTHAGCATNWQFDSSRFTCTCHGSQFNTSGQVVRGPATANLAEFSVNRNGDTLTIQK